MTGDILSISLHNRKRTYLLLFPDIIHTILINFHATSTLHEISAGNILMFLRNLLVHLLRYAILVYGAPPPPFDIFLMKPKCPEFITIYKRKIADQSLAFPVKFAAKVAEVRFGNFPI